MDVIRRVFDNKLAIIHSFFDSRNYYIKAFFRMQIIVRKFLTIRQFS